MKRYSNHPNGKKPPFDFELGDEEEGSVQYFVCTGHPQLLDLMGFAKFAESDISDPAAAMALTDLFQDVMGEDTYTAFMAYCRKWDTDPDVQLQILSDMVAYTLAGRNLGGSSPSADGQQNTPTGSAGGLLSGEDISRWMQAGETAGREAVARAETSPSSPPLPVFTASTPTAYQTALETLRAQGGGVGNPLGLNGAHRTPGGSGTP